MAIKVKNEFEFKQHVWVLTDPDQNFGIVTALVLLPNDLVMYRVSCNGEECDYYDFELSGTKSVI